MTASDLPLAGKGALAAPDLVSDIVVWLAGDASSLITAAQIPADKGYLKI